MNVVEEFTNFILSKLKNYIRRKPEPSFFISAVATYENGYITLSDRRKARVLNAGSFVEGDKVLIIKVSDDELFAYSPLSFTTMTEVTELLAVTAWINIYFDMGCILTDEGAPTQEQQDLLALARSEAEALRDALLGTENIEDVVSGGFYDQNPSFWAKLHPPKLVEQWIEDYQKDNEDNPIIYPEYNYQDTSDAREGIDIIENRYYPIGKNEHNDCIDQLYATGIDWYFEQSVERSAGETTITFNLVNPPSPGGLTHGAMELLIRGNMESPNYPTFKRIEYTGGLIATIYPDTQYTPDYMVRIRLEGIGSLLDFLRDIEGGLKIILHAGDCEEYEYGVFYPLGLFYPYVNMRPENIRFYCAYTNSWGLYSGGFSPGTYKEALILRYFSDLITGTFSDCRVNTFMTCDYYHVYMHNYLSYLPSGRPAIYPEEAYFCIFHPNKGDTIGLALADSGRIVDIKGSRAFIVGINPTTDNSFSITGHATSHINSSEPNGETGDYADFKVGLISIHRICGKQWVTIKAANLDGNWSVDVYATNAVGAFGGDYQTYFDNYKADHPPLPLSGDPLDLTNELLSPTDMYVPPDGVPTEPLILPTDPPIGASHILSIGDIPSGATLALEDITETVDKFNDTLKDEFPFLLNQDNTLSVTRTLNIAESTQLLPAAVYNLVAVIFVTTPMQYSSAFSSVENAFRDYKHIIFIVLPGGSITTLEEDTTVITADVSLTAEERLNVYRKAITSIIDTWTTLENKT